ncbi:MAG: NAD-glutamate dehydrogenase [Pseudomonadales bacterium]|nr:NAD-glutamate dehydrogenase [Pseudomonadales bacterium]
MVNNLKDSAYREFINQLGEIITTRFHDQDASNIADFARNYFSSTYLAELLEEPIEDIYGEVISTWQFVQKLENKKPKVRILNPTIESDGWQTTHTVIEVLAEDMPFIVDSVRMAVNRKNITIHSVINTVFSVERDEKGFLTSTELRASASTTGRQEAVLHIEIDRQSNEKKRAQLRDEISEILDELQLLVNDFPLMLEKLESSKKDLDPCCPKTAESSRSSIIDLVSWLQKDNFTFLGYREYKFDSGGKAETLIGIEGSELGIVKVNKRVDLLDDVSDCSQLTNGGLVFAKSSERSRIHRPAYPELVILNRYDKKGNVIGQHRFLGLFTAKVFQQDPNNIPIIANKISQVIKQTGLNSSSHDFKQLQRIIGNIPREDLFQIDVDTLFETITGILHVKERPWVKLFVHADPFRRFVSCIIYAPRERYSTEMRVKFQDILCQVFEASDVNFSTQFSESVLVQVHIVLKVSPNKAFKCSIDEIERRLVDVCRSWEDDLHMALNELMGEEEAATASATYLRGFSSSYKEDFLPRMAVADIRHIDLMTEENPLELSFYRAIEDPAGIFRFKLFHLNKLIPLSDVIPVMENLGLRILGERPYEVRKKNKKQVIWIHDFTVCYGTNVEISIDKVKDVFQAAFRQIWKGAVENDGFNRMVLGSHLKWQEVMLLRGYAKYLKQVQFPFSQKYIEEALVNNRTITDQLIGLFKVRFDPKKKKERAERESVCIKNLITALDKVDNLDEDRILRRFMEVILGTIRTNFFQWVYAPPEIPYLALKFDPSLIPDLPLPRPLYEIFVYSSRIEGVHLRGGKVARGGIRWSDRMEDFRTEVLGLVKAQQVKNAVIVPVGAKGGFVCKKLPVGGSREATSKEVISCYKLFISALLDVTDNLREGEVIPPENVVRKDRSDPYLVVAADKGTATFSDIANQISIDRGFWLGDAFASGGSVGYDHKKMGITAKGAWISVQRHFREFGQNVQKQAFTVVGIGDMSGDVFGNGMLLSKKIKLLAAFNHLDIFIDPNPNCDKSYLERQRLFDLPRSTWQEYDKGLISKGGGIFSRRAKSIKITAEMQKCFAITDDKLTPNALISAIIKSPADLIWNGGIGTYIKASSENHADVGDKSNDSLRVNGNEMQCRVFGEGGNLGVTQLARVEMGLKGIAINADFIDNSAGVDCSDHEVNIKILLNEVVNNGDLTSKQRNQLLETMTDDVSEMVLKSNYKQAQSISISESLSPNRLDELKRYIHYLEGKGKLNRELEFLPSDDEINERKKTSRGLMRPELSILLSYSKGLLKEQLVDTNLLDDTYISSQIETAFPKLMSSKFKPQMYEHRLRKEIIATQIANSIVNDMGITYVMRMHDASGADPADIAKAYIIAKSIYGLDELWGEIQNLDYKISTEAQIKMMTDISRVVRRATRWFLRNRRGEMDVQTTISHFQPRVNQIRNNLSDYIRGELKESFEASVTALEELGVPDLLAKKVASTSNMLSFLGVIEAADITGHSLDQVAKLYFMLGSELELHWFRMQIHELQTSNHWQAMARETYRDDLDWQQRALTVSVLQSKMKEDSPLEDRISLWKENYQTLLKRWKSMVNELKLSDAQEFSMYAVALRELLDIAQSSAYSCGNIDRENNEENCS